MMSVVKFLFLSLVSVPFAGEATLLSFDIHNRKLLERKVKKTALIETVHR